MSRQERNTVWHNREIQFGKAEKYGLAEQRNTDYCAAAAGAGLWLDDRVSESQTRVAGVYNSLATQRPCHGQNYQRKNTQIQT